MNLDKGGSIGRAIQEYAEFQLWMSDQEQTKTVFEINLRENSVFSPSKRRIRQ